MSALWDEALRPGAPGKESNLGCDIFAHDLFRRLSALGAACVIVAYHWVAMEGETRGLTGDHAIVLYRDGGEVFAMDSMLRNVKPLPVLSIRASAAFFAGNAMQTSNVRIEAENLWDV